MAAVEILVIKLGALGDFIQALGPMAAIRRHHPGDRITLLTTAPFESIARSSGYFNDVILDKRPKWFDLRGWLDLKKNFDAGNFSRVYDLQNNDRTGLYLKLFASRPQWVGAAAGASHRNTSLDRTAGKAFQGHVQTLALAGIDGVNIDSLEWMTGRSDFAGLKNPYALIVPGGSAKHPEKRWPVSQFVSLCKKLADLNIQPVLIGSSAEWDVTTAIKSLVPSCLDLTGQTNLFDIAALARGASAAIGNDTGPMHLIAPTGCKSVVLFSKATNPLRHAPLGTNVVTIQKDDLADLPHDTVWEALRF